jgi:acyl-CoA synthetase (NDP forming)
MADKLLSRPVHQNIIARARSEGRAALDEAAAKALLDVFGIPAPKSLVVVGPDFGTDGLQILAPPYVVKVVSRAILHKSDVGGVTLNVRDIAGVARAIADMAKKPGIAAKPVEGWLVEEMIPSGHEMVVGGFHDPQFGPMIMVGLGGIFVEVLKDVSFRVCPVTSAEAYEMVAELRGAALLDGVRGEVADDKQALIDLILKVGGADGLIMQTADSVAEIDLNPIIVSATGAVAADARFILSPSKVETRAESAAHDQALSARERFKPLFEPKTVAVLGASTKEVAIANTFIQRMKDFGYAGHIYPIHPNATEIEGLKAYPSLGQTPEPVDYAYVAIGAERIPDVIAQANGRCRIAQVISSGFAEVEEGREIERVLVEKARASGVRVLGPNTLGTYSPRGGLTFPQGAPKAIGTVGIVAQSGGLSTDIIKRGEWRGLRFSGLVTIGNSADVAPHELVEYYLEDPQTKVIGLYLEDIKNGRAFFDLLRSPKAKKPVVILKGGRSRQGRLAAASHTGALAGNERAWEALPSQLPVAMVATVDEFLDALLALQYLVPRPSKPTKLVTLFGNGGGSSVLGSDAFASVGLDVLPFDPETLALLEALKLPPGTSVANPIDTPVRTLQEKDGWIAGEILDIVYQHAKPDAVAMHLNLAAFVGRGNVDPLDNLLAVIEHTQRKWQGVAHFLLALRSDGSPQLDEKKRTYRQKAFAAGVPVFDEIPEMAKALSVVGHIEQRLAAQRM